MKRDRSLPNKELMSELTSLRERAAELEHIKMEHLLLAETLRRSQGKYHSIFENAPIGIFCSTTGGKLIEVNPEAARILGYDSPEEIIAVANRTSTAEALYVDPESRPEIVERALASDGRWVEAERQLRRKTGETIVVRFFFRKVPNETRGSELLDGFMEDITRRKRTDTLLRLQRDLALALGSTSSMAEAMERLLHAALQIEGIDAGGVYLLEAASGELRLLSHAGLSSWFIDQISCYGPETPQTRFIVQGEPTYWPNVRGVLGAGALLEREELTSLAVIPIKSKGRVVAVLNLASRTQGEVPEGTRSALETIAARIGGVVSRVGAEEALNAERENLAEANAALKVLLRHREEDHRELEESLLTSVRNLVMPYVEKLMNTRLSSDQALLVEIIEANLREIASPFLRRVSHPLIKLTPMETRVADLIRNGRTTKEIAAVLRTSMRSVRFHRESLRGKLGLKSSKANLRSYLCSLA